MEMNKQCDKCKTIIKFQKRDIKMYAAKKKGSTFHKDEYKGGDVFYWEDYELLEDYKEKAIKCAVCSNIITFKEHNDWYNTIVKSNTSFRRIRSYYHGKGCFNSLETVY